MDLDNMELKMHRIQNEISKGYMPLLHLLERRHFTAFKNLMQHNLGTTASKININHQMPYPIFMSFLDKAASDNLPEFVEFLLEMGADPNIINPERNRAPIHFASEAGNAATLSVLLKNRYVQLNLEAGGLTALHYAVKADSQECTKLLLQSGASPNIINSQGLTVLHYSAEKDKRNMVELIINNNDILDLDTYRDRKKDTTRMIIQRKFPEIILPETLNTPNYKRLLNYYLIANDEINFLKILSTVKDFNTLENKVELLKIAIEHNLYDCVRELLKKKILDPDNLFEFGKIAIEQANPDILLELLNRNYKIANKLLLPASQELGVSAKPGTGNMNNRLECLKMILNQEGVNVRQEDDKGNSCLHYAARAECQEAIELLLQRGCYIGHMNSFGVSPLAHITSDVLENHLNDCLISCNAGTEEYEIIIDYRILVPHSSKTIEDNENENYFKFLPDSSNNYTKACSEIEALIYIANQKNLRHLLKHPLLASFLYLKYLRIRHILYVNFILYLIFFILLNTYIWLTNSAVNSKVSSPNNNKTMFNDYEISGTLRSWKNQPIISVLLSIFLIFMIIRELLQLLSSPFNYIRSLMNWFEVILIGLTLGLLCGASPDVSAMAILLSTWELVILMAQHPRMSIDIEMFKTVTINFAKFLFLYIFLILAFAFSFFILFKENDNFSNPLTSLFKTIVMITGEFDANDLPFVIYPMLSRLVFIGFIFLIVIILLNLLNGLAVNDTAEILAEAELVSLISRTRLVAYVERMIVGSFFLPRIQHCCCINYFLFRNIIKAPLRFLIRKTLLFPYYLPRAKLSMKPLKNFEITLHGRMKNRNRCLILRMDPLIAQRSKNIFTIKSKQSNEDETLIQLNILRKNLERLEINVQEIKNTLISNEIRT